MPGAIITTSITPRGIIKQRAQGAPGGWWWMQGAGGTSVLVEGSQCPLHGASVSENSCREVCAQILACIPNVHAECSIFVLYMIKYIYTFICLMHFMQRKKSSYITLEKYAYAVLIRASLYQFHMYQRCSQPSCLPKKVTSIITLSGLNRKHLYSTITFSKQNKWNPSKQERVGVGESKRPYFVLSLCHLYNYNLRLYIKKNQFVCYIAFHSYTSSRSGYTQQGWKQSRVCLQENSEVGAPSALARVCTFHTFLTADLYSSASSFLLQSKIGPFPPFSLKLNPLVAFGN